MPLMYGQRGLPAPRPFPRLVLRGAVLVDQIAHNCGLADLLSARLLVQPVELVLAQGERGRDPTAFQWLATGVRTPAAVLRFSHHHAGAPIG